MRTLAVASALTAAALLLAGCSDGSDGGDESGSDKASPTMTGTTVDIRIRDGKVTPDGERIKASVDQPVTLRIDADAPGEIHVHSTPEQEIEFDRGTSTKKLTISRPGIVDIEDHAADQVIVQLEVH